MLALRSDFLQGSCPPIVTPFLDGEIDLDVYASLVEFQIANGTHGITVNGTTAEPSTLTVDERNALVSKAVHVARGRVPVIAATGSQSHAETLELSKHAVAAGADALLIVTPYYIRPPQRGLVEYFCDLGARISVPWMIYHIPGRAAVSVEMSTLEQIAARNEAFVGIKHATNDFAAVTAMLSRFGADFRVFVGLEEFTFPMMMMGARGTMNAVANLVPDRIAALCNAIREERVQDARALHFSLNALNLAVFFDTNPIPMKYMMKRIGLLRTNEHRLPMVPASPEVEARLDGVLAAAGLL